MATRVPDTNTFSLMDVLLAVNDHNINAQGNLQSCFDNSESNYFDPNYDNDSYAPPNSMKRFRNYGPPYCYVSRVTYQNDSPGLGSYPRGIWFSDTGAVMFTLHRDSVLKRWNLSTNWDVSTASYYTGLNLNSGKHYSGLYFSPDGCYFFVNNTTNYCVEKWSMSFPFNIGTAIHAGSHYTHYQDYGMRGLYFSPDGTRLYLTGNDYTYTKVYQYNLSTSFDLTSTSYSKSIDIHTNHPLVDVWLTDDGKTMFTLNQDTNTIRQINLGTAWEIDSYWWDCHGHFDNYYDEYASSFFIVKGTEELDMYITGDENSKVYHVKTDEQP